MSATDSPDTNPETKSTNGDHLQQPLHETREKRPEHESESVEKEPTEKDPEGKEMDTQSDTKSGKQSVKEKGDQSQETELQQLTKQLHDTRSAFQSTKKSLKMKTENETLKKQLSDKDKELNQTKAELQSTRDTLNKTKNNLRAKDEDLQKTTTELDELTKQVHDTRSHFQSTKDTLTETKNNLRAKAEDLQETKTKLEERDEQYRKQATVMAECCSKWSMEGEKREQAEKEAEGLRTANEKANGDIRELHREKVLLLWRHALRLVYERQLKTKLRDEIERLKHEHDAARGEWQTQEATLRDGIKELEVKKAELEDQVTHCEMQVKEREGSMQIAKVLVQKLSEQCGANEMIREELDQTKTAHARMDTLYQDTLEQLQREQRDGVQLQANLAREKQLTAAMASTAQQEATYMRGDQERLVVIKEENEKLEKALRVANRCQEEQYEELKKNKSDREKFVAELLNLRRQLTNMTENKDRLQVKCNHLECELVQSPQNSTPNNTNSGHGLDSDTSLDPSLYGLDQLSPVHHSPDFWKR